MFEIQSVYAPYCPDKRATHLLASKIKVIDCVSHSNCSCIETIEITFWGCDDKGIIVGNGEKKTIVIFDIDTGYIHPDFLARELRRELEKHFQIFDINSLIKAFSYRRYFTDLLY